ncbi:DNA helicase MCM8-like [Venturia canescens]|uniref:DNA helicase MCM8-like n=1 Tax=Venturia canescens TaxID=32260 RepID=UPI001C9D31FC|nr:DNA helicase MCM8-like [Venturia canescens]
MNNPGRRFRGGHAGPRRKRRKSSSNQPASNKRRRKENDAPPNEQPNSLPVNPDLDVNAIVRSRNCPYYGWKLYFHDKDYSKEHDLLKKIQATESFLARHQDLISLDGLNAGTAFNIDVNSFYNDNDFLSDWSNFKKEMRENPSETLNCLGLAVHQLVVESLQKNVEGNSIEQLISLPMIRVKVFNHGPIVSLKDLKVCYYGTLVATRGCVIRVGRTRHLAQWVVFSCKKCKLLKVQKQENGILTKPKKCDVCGTAKFVPKLDSPYVITVPFLTIRLQEHFGEESDDRGRMPRILEVELIGDLVGSCMPGDDVTVVGIIKVRGTDDGKRKIKGRKTVRACSIYMEAVSIKNNKSNSKAKSDVGVDLSIKDYFAIKEVHSEPDIFSLLVRSLCPNIYGHEMVKAGLLLSLFGGSLKHASLRDDIHVLMIGDPGLGKSQMLQACARVAAKGVYICGNSSTRSGLTVTLSKEAGSKDFALEPGALVLADRGCCLIDEFDKMPTQHKALLEAMEQQSVTVAKAGVVCSLPARTSILGAANPIGGRYNRAKTVIKNLSMSTPLLSRFDLVFLLLDEPNAMLDSLMCAHIMDSYARGNKNVATSGNTQVETSSSGRISTKSATLRERLTLLNNRMDGLIPQSIIRKYIAYARQYVQPTLSEAAAKILQDFYLELREKTTIFGSIQVYSRQLEALIRLTEARAKLELRVEATAADASDVVELVKCTLTAVPPEVPALNSSSDGGKLTANKVNEFISLLRDEVETEDNRLFRKTDLMEIAQRGGIVIKDFSRFINKLNQEGILIKRDKQLYQFVQD